MMLDALGERYGMLPSEVLERGNTFDLWVFDVAIGYRNLMHDRELDKANGKNKVLPGTATPELVEQLEKYRADQNRRQSNKKTA